MSLLDEELYRSGSRPPASQRDISTNRVPTNNEVAPRFGRRADAFGGINGQMTGIRGFDERPQAAARGYGTQQRSGERPQGTNRYGTNPDRGGERPEAAQRVGYQGQGYTPFEPVTQQVQGNQLMSTHMDSLLDQDSILMQRAAQQGIDFAASRGLGNSSIAAGNAMGSMIDRAMPIAQFDASRYSSVADQNMNAMNQVGMFNNEMGLNYAQLAQSDDHFARTLNFNYDELSQRDRQFLASIGLDREKFEEAKSQFDQEFGFNVMDRNRTFDEGVRQFDSGMGMEGRRIAAGIYSDQMKVVAPIIASIYQNPEISAAEQRAIVEHVSNTVLPGLFNDAWNNVPSYFNPRAVDAGRGMPGMDAPGSQPPTGEQGGINFTRPEGISDYTWEVLQNAVRNATQQP